MAENTRFFFYFIGAAMALLSYFSYGIKDQLFFLALAVLSFAYSESNLDQVRLSFRNLKNIADSKIQISLPGKLLEAIGFALALLWLAMKMFS
jgi:hypothetical protein